jgi:aryl-alcohol dehydrogenase-like predicted oxidoreductase
MASQRRVGALTDHLRPAVPVFAASSSTGRRRLGSTGFEISPVSLGCWQIGGAWGGADDSDAHHAALNRYLDLGGNFLDTADGYGGPLGTPEFGQSEQTIRQVLAERSAAGHTERVYVATKVGRGCEWPPSDLRCWTLESLTNSVDGCRERLGVETLDLVQLHCPPTMVLKDGEVFAHCRALVASGKIQNWGVSVETVEEAFLCIAQSDCAAVQIIFNMFRTRPETSGFLAAAKAADCGVLCRLPLASGLLSGKIDADYVANLDDGDHRKFNAAGCGKTHSSRQLDIKTINLPRQARDKRRGKWRERGVCLFVCLFCCREEFDKGETWSGMGEHLTSHAFPAVAELESGVFAEQLQGAET